MGKEKKVNGVRYDTDVVAINTWRHMLRDFRVHLGNDFCRKAELALVGGGVKSFRVFNFPELGHVPVWRFKAYHQLSSLLKKYRFADDLYTDKELQENTLSKYFAEQERLARKEPTGPLAHLVLSRARKIARSILGSVDQEEIITSCRFGNRSSIGCPLAYAYIDFKLSMKRAFTGSSECTKIFFDSVLTNDALLKEMVEVLGVDRLDATLCTETLSLTTVPKSWKIYRMITPLSLLSLYLSNGIGAVIADRLAMHGLDIRRLQQRHMHLVKRMSVTRTLATADLSAASDSLTKELLNQILPRDWFCMLKKLFVSQVVYKTASGIHRAHTESILPMGNGATFPVETLVFYCLLRAIGELSGTKGLISVYGDDLIYPSRLHRYVSVIFPLLGLKLNLDKTFVGHPFRESCGSDYYRGVDVRPFFFGGERQLLTRTKYLAFLHKTYNGLCRRWDPLEIRSTLRYLLTEMLRVSHVILRVPPEFPDTAGIKTQTPTENLLDDDMIPYSPIKYTHVMGTANTRITFTSLQETSNHRYVISVLPYYWLALQGDVGVTDRKVSPYSVARHQALVWLKTVQQRKYRVGKRIVHKRRVKYLPATTTHEEPSYVVRRGSTSEWS